MISFKRKLALLAIGMATFSMLFTGCGQKQKETKAVKKVDAVKVSDTENTTEKQELETEAKEEVSKPSPSKCGELKVVGTNLCDKDGNSVQLKGISTHGIAWFPGYVNNDAFAQFSQEWNASVMRIAMYTEEYQGYCSDGDKASLEELVRNGVKYATDNDMYVIVDWHILSDTNPLNHKAEAKKFFEKMSKEFSANNNVIYEICNEPNGGTSWADIKSYAKEVIPVIRANDENAVIIVGTPNWSQFVDQAVADPITEWDNIMYTLHFYAATHKDDLRNNMVSAIQAGLPIFVTEFGICDASGNGAIDEASANEWVKVMDENNVSYVAWNLSNKDETSAMFLSSCDKASGFEEDDLSESGKWLYNVLTRD